MEKKFVTAILLAAGSGSRMGAEQTKQRMSILGKTVLRRSAEALACCDDIDAIVVTVRADETEFAASELADISKVIKIIPGGKIRAESAKLAFEAIPRNTDFVAIHDAARCLVTRDMIKRVVDTAKACGAATAGRFVSDTVKRISTDGVITETIPRGELFLASTPQVFAVEIYKKALAEADITESVTDDNSLVEKLGYPIRIVDVGGENIKITTREDIDYAELIIIKRGREKVEQRIGHGYDVHRFAEDRRLILGGVDIPFERGLLGHSDADVLSHAIMDALLGAAGLGDIGRHFPDTDEAFKGISSIELVKRVKALLDSSGYKIVNVDATLVMQRPKIAPYINEMISNLSSALGVEASAVNIKATTEEKLGFTGSGEGAAAHAVCMIEK